MRKRKWGCSGVVLANRDAASAFVPFRSITVLLRWQAAEVCVCHDCRPSRTMALLLLLTAKIPSTQPPVRAHTLDTL